MVKRLSTAEVSILLGVGKQIVRRLYREGVLKGKIRGGVLSFEPFDPDTINLIPKGRPASRCVVSYCFKEKYERPGDYDYIFFINGISAAYLVAATLRKKFTGRVYETWVLDNRKGRWVRFTSRGRRTVDIVDSDHFEPGRRLFMASINKITLIGNLGADPDYSPNKEEARFTLATSEKWKDKKSGELREDTQWHRIVAFGKLSKICADFLSKGRQAYIEGRLKNSKWEDKDGVTRYSTDIIASVVVALGPKPE